MSIHGATGYPRIDPVGLDGVLVCFGESLSEPANRAALAFRAAVEAASPEGVEDCASSLVSTYLRFDPLAVSLDQVIAHLQTLLSTRDWLAAELPQGRRRITIPTVYGGSFGPQLSEAAALAGMDEAAAIQSLSDTEVRVMAIGFAPGMPYMGSLPEAWDIPRQTGLTPKVAAGALVVAIRQFVLFPLETPTGWRQVGQTAARVFDPDSATPFLLRPGDAVRFPAVTPEAFAQMQAAPTGGVEVAAL